MSEDARAGLHVGALLAVPAGAAWLAGLAFVFPSLGPTAFVLATVGDRDRLTPRRVVGGHVVGVLAGLLAYHLLADGAVVAASFDPAAPGMLGLAASGVVATALTAGGMTATGTVHPPACATTLIVSLGLLSTPAAGAVIVAAVCGLYGVHRGVESLRA
jgi:CBS-domain-containing membrane protein